MILVILPLRAVEDYQLGPDSMFKEGVPHGRIDLEHLPGQRDPLGGLLIGYGVDPHPQVVELEDLHVAAEIGRHESEVGGDIQHARVQVAHQAVPAVTQCGADAGRLDPAADLHPGPIVLQVARHRAERDSAGKIPSDSEEATDLNRLSIAVGTGDTRRVARAGKYGI